MQYRITVELPRHFNNDEDLEPAYVDFDCEDGHALNNTAVIVDGCCYAYTEHKDAVFKDPRRRKAHSQARSQKGSRRKHPPCSRARTVNWIHSSRRRQSSYRKTHRENRMSRILRFLRDLKDLWEALG
jgi:hypothetical protein